VHHTAPPYIYTLSLHDALPISVHIAVNHNPAAISMHEANHPGALHLQTDVWAVDPVQMLAGRRVGWFHASPDCTHHSQAAGGQRSEEHTSELQSRENLVCRLLL